MDTVEATKMVMSRIQKLDPDNASKIMGYILIQDQGENEMIRLAFGPENLLHSVIKKAKSFLDISSNTSSTHPQIMIPSNGYHPSSPNSPWSLSGSVSGSFSGSVSGSGSGSYAAVVNGSGSSFLYPGFDDEVGPGPNNNGSGHGSLFDECSTNSESAALFPYSFDGSNNWCNETSNNINMGNNNNHLHRRSCSVNDVFLGGGGGGDDVSGGFGGWRPCMYYNRGFCKNGTACKFVHGNGNNINSNGLVEETGLGSASSPNGKIEVFEDLVRIKAMQQQQQRMAAMNGGPFGFNRCMNFLNENPRSAAAAALIMGDDFHKFGRCRPDRNDFGPMGFGSANSSSRQIYLTFPADSTFKEEDVSNYFSMFGPVQDVRIPYQQKRMFGFVTFMLPETVKAILAKGNPHFVCDSRVLVKPYKEKGKIPDKKHQQQMERGDFSGCLSPTALESAEPFDHIPFGARMFNHEMMIRRKIEERELQQAIEFQDRRLMNLQLNDLNNHHFQRSLSLGGAVSSPTQTTQNLMFSFDGNNEEPVSGANISTQDSMNSAGDASDTNVETTKNESFEQALPDNLFASPTRSTTTDNQTNYSNDMPETDYGAAIPVHVTSKCQGDFLLFNGDHGDFNFAWSRSRIILK